MRHRKSSKFIINLVLFLIPSTVWSAAISVPNKIERIVMKNESPGMAVDILFQRPTSAARTRPTLERNFIQITLNGASMDQARIVPVNNAKTSVEKVFAYPYSPETVRVRLISSSNHPKWNAAWLSKNVTVRSISPRVLRISIGETMVSAPTAAPVTSPSAPSPEDKELIKEVLTNTKEIDLRNPDAIKTTLIQNPTTNQLGAQASAQTNSDTGPVGMKSEPTKYLLRTVLSLVGVLAVFGATVLALKKLGGAKGLPFGKKERIIQVIATHYLGSKKSISLVRVAGEYMVVGTSSEGIRLISKLGPEISVDKYLEDRFWGGTFENHLNSYSKDVSVTKPNAISGYDGVGDLSDVLPAPVTREVASAKLPDASMSSVRNSIREKLQKLKPLT